MMLWSAGMALYLRTLAVVSKVAKLRLFGSLKSLLFNEKSGRRPALESGRIRPRAARGILELEPNTTLYHAERTAI